MRASSAPDDPWRERIASLEVQLSAARATGARTAQELAALRERVERATSQLGEIDASVRGSVERALSTARDALSRAERPLSLQDLDAKIAEIESISQMARAGVAALRQELAENRRLDEARAVRLVSIEDRVTRVEEDPRPAELRLLIDRLEARLLASERERRSLEERVESLEERARASVAAAPPSPPQPTSAPVVGSSLRSIPGIGPKLESRLRALGIDEPGALAALSAADRARLAAQVGLKPAKLDAICEAARGQ